MIDIEPVARAIFAGLIAALVVLVSFDAGSRMQVAYYDENVVLATMLIVSATLIVVMYIIDRRAINEFKCMAKSRRFDLVVAAACGSLIAAYISEGAYFIALLGNVEYYWAALFLAIGCTALGSSIVRGAPARTVSELGAQSFLSDQEIDDAKDDILQNHEQAENFARVVAVESARGSLVFGLDGPWGVGKSSFINLAQNTWDNNEEIIVFRFEPLKFGGEKDMVRAFIRELSGRIRSEFFAPELRPLASRYARLFKTDSAISIPGFRVSFDEQGSTIDEIVNDVDRVLARISRRVIVVIDDLDRIDYEAVTRVLFMVRRSMSATRITYILVYDTERIVANSSDSSTREYLEKFVNAKISLFVDLKDLGRFLRTGWKLSLPSEHSLQSQRVLGLQSILSDLALLLEGDEGGSYIGMVGNVRKLKRFINAMLLMGMERVEFDKTDFSRQDLVHLILLHLNHPGVFRDIYSREGENRSGFFSAAPASSPGTAGYENHADFIEYVKGLDGDSKYLINRLFDVDTLGIRGVSSGGQNKDRACFNSYGRRNLAAYLGLIVRLIVPNPLDTAAVYEGLLERIRKGTTVRDALNDSVLKGDSAAHVKFWGSFAAAVRSFSSTDRADAINLIVSLLPSYDSGRGAGRGTSQRSDVMYSLAIIINSAFEDIDASDAGAGSLAIKYRNLILGDGESLGIIDRLASLDRGALGIHDLMLFRLLCCADRGNQLHNIQLSLAFDGENGQLSLGQANFVIEGVRVISQRSFQIFRERYISSGINFMVEAAGEMSYRASTLEVAVHETWTAGFVIYQLSNTLAPTGSGVGCGYFDASGREDQRGISLVMNTYLFEVCFAPVSELNKFAFADYCLASFSRDYFDEGGSVPTQQSLEAGLDPQSFRAFWLRYGDTYRRAKLEQYERTVVTVNYSAAYSKLPEVWDVLDTAYGLARIEEA